MGKFSHQNPRASSDASILYYDEEIEAKSLRRLHGQHPEAIALALLVCSSTFRL